MRRFRPQPKFIVGGVLVFLGTLATFASLSSASSEIGEGEVSDFNPTVDERVVQAGDTLWDIAEEVLGDPVLWPKVWSMNPEITNPHWVYPGDIIRFYQPKNIEPSLYGSMNAGRVVEASEQTITSAAMGASEDEDSSDDDYPEYTGPAIEEVNALPMESLGTGKTRRYRGIYSGVFVSPNKMKVAGTISNASPDRELLGVSDRVFLTLDNPSSTKKGDTFMTFRELGEVRHPSSGDFTGYLNAVTGKIVVDEITDGVAKGRVSNVYSEISRGQFVTPFVQEPFSKVKANDGPSKQVEGEIIIIQTEEHSLGGEHVLAIVDRGSSHGIQVGNRFTVWGVGDVGVGDGEELAEDDPDRKLQSGELLVLSVQKGTATCTVTKSNRELDVGNRVTSIGKSRLPTPSR